MAANELLIDWNLVLGDLLGSSCGISNDELKQLNAAIGEHSARAVRLHPLTDESTLPFETQPIPWFERGRWLVDNQCRPGAFLHYAVGDYYIQDAGSMLALALCDVQPGQTFCDTCAAPGGKSSGLLEQLGASGIVVSNEVIRSRLELLELTLARTGLANYLVTNCEVEALAERFNDSFDCVMVDAPCTGQSMLARGKQSMAAFSAKQIEHSAARQQRILRAASQLVKPGGRLVYSTCTFAFAENEGMISWLRGEHPDWVPLSDPKLAAWESRDHAGCYRLWPHRDRCAGAFAAALQRPIDSPLGPTSMTPIEPPSKRSRGRQAGRQAGRAASFSAVEVPPSDLPWLRPATSQPLGLWRRGSELHYFSADLPREWIEAAHAGVPIAELRGGEWQPSYASSLVTCPTFEPTNSFELESQQAAEYFAGAAIRHSANGPSANDPSANQINPRLTNGSGSQSSWWSLTWQNRRLAWSKLAAGVFKNHLPKTLRKTQLIAPAPPRATPYTPQLPDG